MPQIYHFDPVTGELLRDSEARLDPIDQQPLVPRFATLIEPPSTDTGTVAVFDGEAWQQEIDRRGETYWLPDGKEVQIEQIGDLPPAEALSEAPLEYRKTAALREVRAIAKAVRKRAADYAPYDRALGWALKAVYAAAWAAYEVSPNAALQPLAEVAQAGFALETDLTGGDPVAVRDTAISKSARFFKALQLVEGMELLAESRFPAVETEEDLQSTIDQLRALETQALASLEEVMAEA